MKNNKTKKLTLIGMLGAISILLGMTPLGFIPLGPVNYTIMHIPVIIGAVLGGPVVGAAVGFIFGVSSILKAITTPTIVSPFFMNPLVSVLPRIAIGLISYYIYFGLKKMGNQITIYLAGVTGLGACIFLGHQILLGIETYKKTQSGLLGLIISFVILVFIVGCSLYSYKKFSKDSAAIVLTGAIGSMSNTILVLGTIYILYGADFVSRLGGDPQIAGTVILTLGLTNGIPEMILSMVLVTSIVVAVNKSKKE